MKKIQELSTKELVKELATRKGVEVVEVEPYKEEIIKVNGPTIVIKVVD